MLEVASRNSNTSNFQADSGFWAWISGNIFGNSDMKALNLNTVGTTAGCRQDRKNHFPDFSKLSGVCWSLVSFNNWWQGHISQSTMQHWTHFDLSSTKSHEKSARTEQFDDSFIGSSGFIISVVTGHKKRWLPRALYHRNRNGVLGQWRKRSLNFFLYK